MSKHTVDDILSLFLMTYGSLSLKSVLPLKAFNNQKDIKKKINSLSQFWCPITLILLPRILLTII